MVGNALPWRAPGKGPFPQTSAIPLPAVRDDGRWLIALDLDGTTVDQDNRASAAVQAAIDRAQAAGHVIMIASGRPIQGIEGVWRELGLTSRYSVCSNGAVVCDMTPERGLPADAVGGWRVVDMTLFDPAPVIDAILPALPEARYAVEDADQGWRFSRPFTAGTFGAPARLATIDELRAQPVTRIVAFSPGRDTDEFKRIIRGIGLHEVSYAVGWSAWLDIAPYGVNKASALEKVRRRLGIPRSRVAVVGDGLNDREMLAWAADEGLGCAMGHALPEVQAVGNRVVGTLAEDGVAEAIDLVLAGGR